MTETRRWLSMIAGNSDADTKAFFKGVYSEKTLQIAENVTDFNTKNLFFIHVDDYFITVFTSPDFCIVIDGFTVNKYSPLIDSFIGFLSEGVPVTRLPFKMIDRSGSLLFCLLFAVGLCKGLSVISIIENFGFKTNNVIKNRQIVDAWFVDRYE